MLHGNVSCMCLVVSCGRWSYSLTCESSGDFADLRLGLLGVGCKSPAYNRAAVSPPSLSLPEEWWAVGPGLWGLGWWLGVMV